MCQWAIHPYKELCIIILLLLYGKQCWGNSECSDWFFLGQDFAVWSVSMEMVMSRVFYLRVPSDIHAWHPQFRMLVISTLFLSEKGMKWQSNCWITNYQLYPQSRLSWSNSNKFSWTKKSTGNHSQPRVTTNWLIIIKSILLTIIWLPVVTCSYLWLPVKKTAFICFK